MVEALALNDTFNSAEFRAPPWSYLEVTGEGPDSADAWFGQTHGVLRFEALSPGAIGILALNSLEFAPLHGTQWRFKFPSGSDTSTVTLRLTSSTMALTLSAGPVNSSGTGEWVNNGPIEWSTPDGAKQSADWPAGWVSNTGLVFDSSYRYFRLFRRRPSCWIPMEVLELEGSTDGIHWVMMNSTGIQAHSSWSFQLSLELRGSVDVEDVHGIIVPGVWDSNPAAKTPRAPRTLNPDATVDSRANGCASLLELIREFSAAVRGAVRIVNAATIEIVDPNEPLPDQWDADSGAVHYSRTAQTLQAATRTLQLSKGSADLTVTAEVVADDAGLVVGGFRIPARLPGPPMPYGLDPAPVSRLSYTFTPTHFSSSIELFYPDTPLIVRDR